MDASRDSIGSRGVQCESADKITHARNGGTEVKRNGSTTPYLQRKQWLLWSAKSKAATGERFPAITATGATSNQLMRQSQTMSATDISILLRRLAEWKMGHYPLGASLSIGWMHDMKSSEWCLTSGQSPYALGALEGNIAAQRQASPSAVGSRARVSLPPILAPSSRSARESFDRASNAESSANGDIIRGRQSVPCLQAVVRSWARLIELRRNTRVRSRPTLPAVTLARCRNKSPFKDSGCDGPVTECTEEYTVRILGFMVASLNLCGEI